MSSIPRQPRKLHYFKCHQCRADRQKCTPTDRPWPGPKCDRCIKFNYPCSASVIAKGLNKGLNASQPSQGTEPVPLSFNVEDCSSDVGHAGAQSDQLGFHALWNPFDTDQSFHGVSRNQFDTSITGQSFPAVSSTERPLADKPSLDQARPRCSKFFIMLQHAIWSPTNSRPADPLISMARVFYALMMEDKLRITRVLYFRLRERECLVEISREHEVKIQREIARGMSRGKAVKAIVTDAIANVSQELPEIGNGLSPVQHIMAFTQMIRAGDRWRELVDAVGAREILLMDANHPKCDRNCGPVAHYSENGEVETLERCPKRCPSLSVRRIMAQGTDEDFTKFKKTLLAPELQLERTCQRLSGLVTLIHGLFQRNDQEDPIIKGLFTPYYHLTQGPFKYGLSDLDSFLMLEIPRRIKDIFGSDPFLLPPEWSDPGDGDDDDDNDGEDANNNDDDYDNENDDSFRNDVFGNNEGQNKAEFSEDFSTRFSSNNPFASR